jgi:hypothetical protein
MLRNVGKNFSEEKLTALFPIRGDKYNGELMVVGRAINSWGYEDETIRWNSKNGNPPEVIIENIIRYSLSDDKDVDCPMKWITDHWGSDAEGNKQAFQYNMKKSAFWRVIKEILSDLKITSSEAEKKNWSSYLVWTDLYKVASPDGGNPSNRLCEAQFEQCKLLLKEEIATFKPKRILFLTGYIWFKDFEDIGFNGRDRKESLVEWVGSYDKTEVIVAKHPQGKDETEYVKQVIKYFQ